MSERFVCQITSVFLRFSVYHYLAEGLAMTSDFEQNPGWIDGYGASIQWDHEYWHLSVGEFFHAEDELL